VPPNNPTPGLLDDLRLLAERIVRNGNLLEILVNCYCLCHQYRTELFNCENDDRLLNLRADRFQAFREVFERHHRVSTASGAVVRVLRQRLAARAPREALVSVAALLQALSYHVEWSITALSPWARHSATSGPAFGNEEFWLAPRPKSPIIERAPALPRREEEISDMLSLYNPTLLITQRRLDQIELLPVQLPLVTWRFLESRVDGLRIAMASMGAEARFQLEVAVGFPAGTPARFRAVNIEAPDGDRLRSLLQECAERRVAILVLPELRVPPEALASIRQFLRGQTRAELEAGRGLVLVVAGSWHEADAGGWVNRARVLDHKGDEVWPHDKLAEFHITPENVRENPAFFAELGIGEHGGREQIERGTCLQFCDSPVGRLAVAICTGFFHQPLEQGLIESATDLFLIPAMTWDTRPLEERANSLVRSQQAATFVANCGTAGAQRAPCFFRLPWRNSEPRKAEKDEDPLVFDLNDSLSLYVKPRPV
jgi:predicted amidohydrolase